jgi:hypothetical protein
MRDEFLRRRTVLEEPVQPALRRCGTSSRPSASAKAVKVPIVGFGLPTPNSRRTASGANSARRATSAFDNPSSSRPSSSALANGLRMEADAADRRVQRLVVTGQVEAFDEPEVRHAQSAFVQTVFGGLTDSERRSLLAMVAPCLARLSEPAPAPGGS